MLAGPSQSSRRARKDWEGFRPPSRRTRPPSASRSKTTRTARQPGRSSDDRSSLRPYLPADARRCARTSFAPASTERRRRIIPRRNARPGPSAADDAGPSARRSAAVLTLIATEDGEVVGFASLKGADIVEMLFVDARIMRKGAGVGTALLDALTKLARGRRAAPSGSPVEVSDTAKPLFDRQGFIQPPETQPHPEGRRMARQHHDDVKSLDKPSGPSNIEATLMSPRERLYLFDTTLRDGALTTGVDFSLDDKRHIAAARRSRRRLCRGRLSRRQSARHEVLRAKPTRNARASAPSA